MNKGQEMYKEDDVSENVNVPDIIEKKRNRRVADPACYRNCP